MFISVIISPLTITALFLCHGSAMVQLHAVMPTKKNSFFKLSNCEMRFTQQKDKFRLFFATLRRFYDVS
jgi:hypothetical protein